MFAALRAEDPERISLYLARHEDDLVAATVLIRVGAHAWYAYGASSTRKREVRGSNACQWTMIRDSLAAGCAILGSELDLTAGEVDRIALSHGFFRIHQETEPETGSENSTAIVPADIPAESRALVQETAKAVYRALGCRGLARVDMFLKENGEVVLNEVNTLPGMTSYSRYPRMMAAAELPLAEVIDRMVSLALTGKSR